MNLGKQKRLARLFNTTSQRTVIVPLDHGVSVGPIEGLETIRETVADMVLGGANAVLMHKGLVQHSGCCAEHAGAGLIVHLSASTCLSPASNTKVLVGSVEEGLRLGAESISIHVNVGDPNDRMMLEDAGRVAEACDRWGVPLLMMLYARGPQIKNCFAPDVVAHCARLGAELGADIVKVPYTGSRESFAHVVNTCPVPVVIAGGERMNSTRQLLSLVSDALHAGCAGLSVGRNVFQHPNRVNLVRALCALVHRGASVEEALELAGDPSLANRAA